MDKGVYTNQKYVCYNWKKLLLEKIRLSYTVGTKGVKPVKFECHTSVTRLLDTFKCYNTDCF